MDVPVTLRTRTPRQPTFATQGTTPAPDCPLAVTPAMVYDHDTDRWVRHSLGGYYVTHRATGYNLGTRFATAEEAEAALDRCEWRFPAWAAATGGETDPATLACRVKWRAATSV